MPKRPRGRDSQRGNAFQNGSWARTLSARPPASRIPAAPSSQASTMSSSTSERWMNDLNVDELMDPYDNQQSGASSSVLDHHSTSAASTSSSLPLAGGMRASSRNVLVGTSSNSTLFARTSTKGAGAAAAAAAASGANVAPSSSSSSSVHSGAVATNAQPAGQDLELLIGDDRRVAGGDGTLHNNGGQPTPRGPHGGRSGSQENQALAHHHQHQQQEQQQQQQQQQQQRQQQQQQQQPTTTTTTQPGIRRGGSAMSSSAPSEPATPQQEPYLRRNESSSSQLAEGMHTSLEVFLRFVRRVEDGTIDSSGVLSSACYEEWVRTRRNVLKAPQESFRRTLTAHVTGLDGRKAFPAHVEASLLEELRKQRIWPCFRGQIVGGRPSNIGLQGFRTLGWHERVARGLANKPRKSQAQKKTQRGRKRPDRKPRAPPSDRGSDLSGAHLDDAGSRDDDGHSDNEDSDDRESGGNDAGSDSQGSFADSRRTRKKRTRGSPRPKRVARPRHRGEHSAGASAQTGAPQLDLPANVPFPAQDVNAPGAAPLLSQVTSSLWMDNLSVVDLLLRVFGIHVNEYAPDASFQSPRQQALALLSPNAVPSTLRALFAYNATRYSAPHIFCACYGATIGLNPSALQPNVLMALSQPSDMVNVQRFSWFTPPGMQQFAPGAPVGNLLLCGSTLVVLGADLMAMQVLEANPAGAHLTQLMDPVYFWAGLASFGVALFTSQAPVWAQLRLQPRQHTVPPRNFLTRWTWQGYNLAIAFQALPS